MVAPRKAWSRVCAPKNVRDGWGTQLASPSAGNAVIPIEGERRLAAAGIDAAAAQRSVQLELRSSTETYLRDGRFDQDRMLEAFEEMASRNARQGFLLSRIVCPHGLGGRGAFSSSSSRM